MISAANYCGASLRGKMTMTVLSPMEVSNESFPQAP
jgi:hypothetical protein